MKQIIIPTAEQIVLLNEFICKEQGNVHHCYDVGKVESAIYTAFYPGSYPFAAGGIAKVAGALCFYIVKSHAFTDGNKRTGALTAITFLKQNGYKIQYPLDVENNINEFARVIEDCAASNISKDELIEWFDQHKIKIKI